MKICSWYVRLAPTQSFLLSLCAKPFGTAVTPLQDSYASFPTLVCVPSLRVRPLLSLHSVAHSRGARGVKQNCLRGVENSDLRLLLFCPPSGPPLTPAPLTLAQNAISLCICVEYDLTEQDLTGSASAPKQVAVKALTPARQSQVWRTRGEVA